MSPGLAMGRGAALACVSGALVYAVVLVADLADTDTGAVFFVGALAGILVGLSSRSGKFEMFGAVMVGALALAGGAWTGFGWLEIALLVGSVIAASWVTTGEWRPRNPWPWFRYGGMLLLVLVVLVLPLTLDGGTLGHDESAYALKARQWLEGTPGSGWAPHRGMGMSVYGYLVLAMGGAEPGLRMLGLAGLLGLVAGVWDLGRRMANHRVGGIAALAAIAGPSVLLRGTEYLSDVPAAALLVFCMVVVWRELIDREEVRYQLLWALPLAWGAFYLRYQSALSLGLMAVIAVLLCWPKIRQRPGPVLWLIVVGLLGLIPHFAQSIELTGRPWGILFGTTSGAVRAYLGEGLVDYAEQIGWQLGGYVAPVVLAAALLVVITKWARRERRDRYLFLLFPALVQVVALGLISHGEPRFVFFPLALIVVAGVMAIDTWVMKLRPLWSRTLAWASIVLLAGSFALSASTASQSVEIRKANNEAIELAAVEVLDQAGEDSCSVLTSYRPQITFYSGCATIEFDSNLDPAELVGRLQGESRFLVLLEGGKSQPQGKALTALVELTDGEPVVLEGAGSTAKVYVFEE